MSDSADLTSFIAKHQEFMTLFQGKAAAAHDKPALDIFLEHRGQLEPKRVINSWSFVSQNADLILLIAKTQEFMTLLGSSSL